MITRTLPANRGKGTKDNDSPFLILIGCFVTLEGMKIKSVTPMHHLMIMVSSVSVALGRVSRDPSGTSTSYTENPQLRSTTADSHRRYGTFRPSYYVFRGMENGQWPAWMRVSWATGALPVNTLRVIEPLKTEGHVRREMAVTLA